MKGIAEMLKSFGQTFGDSEPEDGQKTEEEVNDVEDETDDDNDSEETSEESDDTETETSDEVTVDPKINELEMQIRNLQAKLDSFSKSEEVEETINDISFLHDVDDVDELISNKDSLNKLLNKVYKQARLDVKTELEKRDEKIPEVLTNRERMQQLTTTFYNTNKDLANFKGAVATVFNDISEKNPGSSYEYLLAETAKETRKRLGLDKLKTKPSPPPLPRGKTKGSKNRQEPKTQSKSASEIQEMNAALMR